MFKRFSKTVFNRVQRFCTSSKKYEKLSIGEELYLRGLYVTLPTTIVIVSFTELSINTTENSIEYFIVQATYGAIVGGLIGLSYPISYPAITVYSIYQNWHKNRKEMFDRNP